MFFVLPEVTNMSITSKIASSRSKGAVSSSSLPASILEKIQNIIDQCQQMRRRLTNGLQIQALLVAEIALT